MAYPTASTVKMVSCWSIAQICVSKFTKVEVYAEWTYLAPASELAGSYGYSIEIWNLFHCFRCWRDNTSFLSDQFVHEVNYLLKLNHRSTGATRVQHLQSLRFLSIAIYLETNMKPLDYQYPIAV